ncbi:uncharacterized protein LOC127879573 [Dreissena polymorpha]|uniref:uncharacterized protein LOC127879573 n=1 Tax=Dreissena polymorpha TaxID=45954 RepID=UPI002264082F|nr:uncharacterized protein LOC127879573 [Dreissena polymorpha]
MKTIGAFVCVIALCYAATTHRPHGGHDHNEQDSATFQYVGSTQHLLVQWYPDKSTYNCYIVSLTDVEKAQVHTDAGMRAVEIRVLGQLSQAALVHDASTLNSHDVHACGHGKNHTTPAYYILSV